MRKPWWLDKLKITLFDVWSIAAQRNRPRLTAIFAATNYSRFKLLQPQLLPKKSLPNTPIDEYPFIFPFSYAWTLPFALHKHTTRTVYLIELTKSYSTTTDEHVVMKPQIHSLLAFTVKWAPHDSGERNGSVLFPSWFLHRNGIIGSKVLPCSHRQVGPPTRRRRPHPSRLKPHLP